MKHSLFKTGKIGVLFSMGAKNRLLLLPDY
jgi:hypothetical protein